jgi:hypothetical protein
MCVWNLFIHVNYRSRSVPEAATSQELVMFMTNPKHKGGDKVARHSVVGEGYAAHT